MQQFGRYELIRPIASGGMATVHLGRVVGAGGFQRLVAIKVMHPHIAADPDFVNMFLDEARLAAGIRHPNVVATIDVPTAHHAKRRPPRKKSALSLRRARRPAHSPSARMPSR